MKDRHESETTGTSEDDGNDAVMPTANVRLDRREVMTRLGKLAAYTPPIMLSLMVSQGLKADQFGSNPPPPIP